MYVVKEFLRILCLVKVLFVKKKKKLIVRS